MAWYVVCQVEGNDNFLVFPPDPATWLRFGYWPCTHPQMQTVRGGRRAWALARRWAVDGRWAECMRVDQTHNPDMRAIRIDDAAREGALQLAEIRAMRTAQRTWTQVTRNLQASYSSCSGPLLPSLQLPSSRANAHAVIDLQRGYHDHRRSS